MNRLTDEGELQESFLRSKISGNVWVFHSAGGDPPKVEWKQQALNYRGMLVESETLSAGRMQEILGLRGELAVAKKDVEYFRKLSVESDRKLAKIQEVFEDDLPF